MRYAFLACCAFVFSGIHARVEAASRPIVQGPVTIAPRGYLYNTFRVDSLPARVSGHWTTAGGDIRVHILAATAFPHWQNEHTTHAIYRSSPRTDTNVDAVLQERGDYVVVLDNTFSGGSRRTVSGTLTLLDGEDAAEVERASKLLKSSRTHAGAEAASRPIVNGPVSVAPRGYLYHPFRVDIVPARVTGRWTSSGGEVRLYIFTATDFLNWQDKYSTHPIYCSCSDTEANVDAVVAEPGDYVVVFDNTFSGGDRKALSGALKLSEGEAAEAEGSSTPAVQGSRGAAPCSCAGSSPASPKSPDTAAAWAVRTTMAGWLIAGIGMGADNGGLFLLGATASVFGPSAGHFYAGEVGHGLTTSLIRTTGLFLAGAVVAANVEGYPWNDHSQGQGLFATSLLVVAGVGLYDWIDAPRAARRANHRNGFDLGLAPMPPDRNGRLTLGLALSHKF